MMAENEITKVVIGCAIKVHKVLGPGLLESAYETCLAYELKRCDLYIERQRPIPLVYQEVKLDCGYRADLIVEIKAVEALNEIHFMQALTHIKLLDVRIGLPSISTFQD